MNAKNNTFILLSLAVISFIGIIIFSNATLKGVKQDFSEGQIYTLSDGAKNIAASINEPTYFYLYFSEKAGLGTPSWYNHGQRIKEVLQEFREASNGMIRLRFVDPLPFTEAEDQANFLKLTAVDLGNGQNFYLGLVARGPSGAEQVVPLLDPEKEGFLEYDIAKLLNEVTNVDKAKVGLITDLPMTGDYDPYTRQRRIGWIAFERLNSTFDVTVIPRNSVTLPVDLDALVVVHPKELPERTQKAIDQYVMNGGRLLLFVDPYSELEVFFAGNDIQSRLTAQGSNLPELMNAWGVQLKPNTLLADSDYALELQTQDNATVRHPSFPQFSNAAFNEKEPSINNLRRINMAWTGVLEPTEGATTRMTPLIRSSINAGLLDGDAARYVLNPNDLYKHFEADKKRHVVAAKISGPAKSAFADSKIKQADNINVVVVADADLLGDFFWVDMRTEGERRVAQTIADNGNFFINTLDQLTGGTDLLSIRSKGSYQRPFDVVRDLRREAEERLRKKEAELQNELKTAQEKIKTLGGIDQITADTVVNKQQQDAIYRFQERIAQIRGELRDVRSNLNTEIDDLGSRVKAINIGSMIFLVAFAGLVVVGIRKSQLRAKA